MSYRYTVKFKRKSKEEYWTVKEGMSIWRLESILEELLGKTDQDYIIVRIEKEKL